MDLITKSMDKRVKGHDVLTQKSMQSLYDMCVVCSGIAVAIKEDNSALFIFYANSFIT